MWNKRLAARTQSYSSGVLSIVDANGYPLSVRCTVCLNETGHVFTFPTPPPQALSWRGKACLLFHQHNERLEGLRQLVILGELVCEEGLLTFLASKFVTSNGRQDTDQMPHAASPLHLLRFLWLGWRSARTYLARRRGPWPAIPYEEFERLLAEEFPS
ncbi:MAG TPA: hypothetical protein VFN35_08905 [Ktedonobacteraceae bacterium]|nr:hypothetical protein [Ktedonobacteraceae bacterium]